tara:strand:- start:57 stop:500 length:444 start_codon:yes stop_codon:yes gene_type:complete
MAKFIKFKISNATTLAAGGDYARDVLVGVDDIENAADAVGAGVYTVILTLKSIVGLSDAAIANSTIGGRILTLTVSTSPIAAANPTAITVSQNMPSQSVIRALTANPGGVSSTCQLGVDGNGVVAAQGGTAAQMYWSSAVFSSNNDL